MCAIDGITLTRIFAMNRKTQTISFFGVTFTELEKFTINQFAHYSIKELSFAYCIGLTNMKGNFATIFNAIGKNNNLSTSLTSIEFIGNKIGSEEVVKNALVLANISQAILSFDQSL